MQVQILPTPFLFYKKERKSCIMKIKKANYDEKYKEIKDRLEAADLVDASMYSMAQIADIQRNLTKISIVFNPRNMTLKVVGRSPR